MMDKEDVLESGGKANSAVVYDGYDGYDGYEKRYHTSCCKIWIVGLIEALRE